MTSDFLNGVQAELLNVLASAGIAPNKAAHNQLLLAIQSIVGGSAVVGAGAIHGMQISNTPGYVTTRMTVSRGLCRDSTNVAGGILPAPISKRLDAAWAPGDGNGGRLSGALANGGSFWLFALINPVTGAVEVGYDASPTAPDIAGSGAAGLGYTKFRRLGGIVLEASSTNIREMYQNGDYFEYKLRSTDYAVQSNGGGVSYLRPYAVPIGVPLFVRLHYQSTGTANATAMWSGPFNPAFGAPPAFGSASQRAAIRRVAAYQQASGVDLSYGTADGFWCMCDSSGRIYTASSDNADVMASGVIGWIDERGRFF